MPDQIKKELEEAKAGGQAPQFEVKTFEIEESKAEDGRRKKRVFISMILDGQEVGAARELIVESGDHLKYRACLINLIEEAIKENMSERWPDFVKKINSTKSVNHAVHELKSGKDCIFSVSMHIKVPFGKKRLRPLHVKGIDEIDARMSVLVTAYHWVVWQLKLIEQKKAEKKKA